MELIPLSSISVTRDAEGNTGVFSLDIAKITYMEFERTIYRIIVHTYDQTYYTVGTLKYWVNTLASSGYNFVLADRNTLIHVSNIIQLDKTFHIAYFGEDHRGIEQKCFLSEKGYKEILNNVRTSDNEVKFVELPQW
ncbi:LytTR family transcriptional regulator DNA-binding domain-containing protein [Paenibacillus sp. MMS20-IR301]|uniref:LytTR family transcriptional regulator DNA-binding domain-containing protein n=1 Tax=Paenibacillus sp. MMS20-IR301 TaxID=2895946 RepID=UPI0037CBAC35